MSDTRRFISGGMGCFSLWITVTFWLVFVAIAGGVVMTLMGIG